MRGNLSFSPFFASYLFLKAPQDPQPADSILPVHPFNSYSHYSTSSSSSSSTLPPSIYPSINLLTICPCVHLSIYHLFVSAFIYSYILLFFLPSIHPSVTHLSSTYPTVRLFVCLSIIYSTIYHPSIHHPSLINLSVHLF